MRRRSWNGCLEQVDEWEPKVHAWVVLDRDRATRTGPRARSTSCKRQRPRAAARDSDRNQGHHRRGRTADGLRVEALGRRIADADAKVVANLRKAGAVIMGKTVTTPYAWIDPPVTRNPWNLERTPGGSSSGSAAAVACGMCFGAIGTQTGGSITRPASFCGVAGMKPTQGLDRPLEGVMPLAPSLDHVGPIARTVDDLRILFRGDPSRSRSTQERSRMRAAHIASRLRSASAGCEASSTAGPKRPCDPRSTTRSERSRRSGATIVELDDPVDFEQVLSDHRRVMAAEAAGVHSDWLDESPDDYPPRITDLVLEGRSLPALGLPACQGSAMSPTMESIMAALCSATSSTP